MEQIINKKIEQFLNKYSIKNKSVSEDFEIFSNYIAIYKHINKYEKGYNEIVSVGITQDIDGIIFILRDKKKILESTDDLEENIDKDEDNKIYIDFIFTQAKNGKLEDSIFDKISRFISDFENSENNLDNYKFDKNSQIDNILSIRSEVFSLQKKLPIVINSYAYVFTKQKYENKKNPSYEQLKNKTTSFIFDSDKIRETIKNFEGSYKIHGVKIQDHFEIDKCLFGIITFGEFKKIIRDKDGGLRINIFEDNIRHYQGDTQVNKKIEETINKGNFLDFPLLNNGITIIAKDYNDQKNNIYTITNPKIVNGCQTTYTLFRKKDIPNIDNLQIPFKLIIESNNDQKNIITLAANTQNPIDNFLEVSLNDFNKQLEDFYESKPKPIQFHYDRLKGSKLNKSNLIEVQEQAKCFIATFLEEPNKAVGWGKKSIIDYDKEKKIYSSNHSLFQYYLSYYLYFILRKIELYKYSNRYHNLFCLFKTLTLYPKLCDFEFSKFGSNMEKDCNEIINWVCKNENTKSFYDICKIAMEITNKCLYKKSRYVKKHNDNIVKELKVKYGTL